ncbi:hypothetical protein RR42_m0163 [Cupriavidus basilensis]|uniref:Uncharacterized protein n=1 Tax=Cupriavidus basilensis TaxID=68895 RepID=A0A0C4Y447_9BURK|nr:hypothetical protein RR42_m0163 [Cupriavidus basilensis]
MQQAQNRLSRVLWPVPGQAARPWFSPMYFAVRQGKEISC